MSRTSRRLLSEGADSGGSITRPTAARANLGSQCGPVLIGEERYTERLKLR